MKNISRRAVLLGGAATAAGLALPTSKASADIDPFPPIQLPAPRPVVGFPGFNRSNIFVRWSDYGIRVKHWNEDNNNLGGPWVNLGKPNGLNTVGSPGAVYTNRQYVFARANDNTVWVASQNDDDTWTSWSSLGGSVASNIEVIGVWGAAGSYPKPVYVFARDANGGLVYRSNHGLGWGVWTVLSGAGTVTGNPSAGKYFPDGGDPQPRVFVRWAADDSVRYTQRNPNGTWSAWTTLGTTATADPAVAPGGANLLYQRGYDGRLWYRYKPYASPTWSGWNLLILDPSNPGMKIKGSVAFDSVSVFEKGFVRDENDAIWGLDGHWYNGHWEQHAPSYLGGVVSGNVGAGHNDTTRQWALVRGMDNALWAREYNGGWVSLGGSLV
ncbi:hypothetical protein [Allorhizocola rhizosphaerae]|uniref:hypothetical protein n=1 Tax=Allorhizocola rhizosphaerae TaxID=1872709 RepID=UPI0013C2B0CF|nr:hypothetical protein [Allorhizocola rhizosphaerae]